MPVKLLWWFYLFLKQWRNNLWKALVLVLQWALCVGMLCLLLTNRPASLDLMIQVLFVSLLSGILCHYMSVLEVVAFKRQCLFKLKIRFSEKHLLLVTTFMKYFDGSLSVLVKLVLAFTAKTFAQEEQGTIDAVWWWKSTVWTEGISTQRMYAWPQNNSWQCWTWSGTASVYSPASVISVSVHTTAPTIKSSLLAVPHVTITLSFCCLKHNRERGLQPAESVGCAQPVAVTAHLSSGYGHHQWEHILTQAVL